MGNTKENRKCIECEFYCDDNSCKVNFGVTLYDDKACSLFSEANVKCLDCGKAINHSKAPTHECQA